MEKGKDVLKPHSPDRKMLKVHKGKQIEWASNASSSNSEWPEQKLTVNGLGGIGPTNIDISNSNITLTCGKVQTNNYTRISRRTDLGVSKDTRGNILPTSKFFGETTTKRNMLEIWDLIIGDVKKIGVYGMGGIGKTTLMKHINNRILEEKQDKFDCVIWVSVSKESSIFKLQHDISRKLGLDLSADEDPITRAGALFEELTKRGRYLLILDDLWEGYPLEDVGIPDPDHPTSFNICKLVLTTRSLDVCRSMKCKAFKMDLLSKDEAWSLFLHHVGHEVLHDKDLEPIARSVALECACLPLAIAIIGRSMAGNEETCDWKDALAKLKAFSKEPGDKGRIVIEQLKFSFDRLENKKFQKCLMYCALYPEDDEIDREELVELLILEGILEEKESKIAEIDEGNAILNKLINQCLLEGKKSQYVKMHDLVRDMTLQIDDLHSQYLTISGTEMKKLSQVKWSDLLKMHISYCDSLNALPMCQKLTTFILHYSSLRNITDSFFQNFETLKVLQLSYCAGLKVLPDSISNLVNLVGLFITYCTDLRYVTTLAKLKNLEKLVVRYCSKLEEIVGESLDNDKDLNEAMTCVTLPKLRSLELCFLPNLKSIGSPARPLICKSLRDIYISYCPKLDRCVYAEFGGQWGTISFNVSSTN